MSPELPSFLVVDQWASNAVLGRFPFVRTDRPDNSRRNKDFTFNQYYPVRSVKSLIVYTKENVFQQKLLGKAYFIFKLTGQPMVLPASSDKWKALLDCCGK